MLISESEKCLHIKNLVESFSKVLNIGTKDRSNEVADLRKIYCKICKATTKASLRVIGSNLRPGFDHVTVMNNIKRFDELFFTNQLLFIDVYRLVLVELKREELGYDDALINEYTNFLNWFRLEVFETTPIKSEFFVGKYFSKHINK